MTNDNDNYSQELDLDTLEEVTGGVILGHPDVIENTLGNLSAAQGRRGAQAYCKSCGKQVTYIGETRVAGGNTGQYKCTNTSCKECGKIKYNDQVDWK